MPPALVPGAEGTPLSASAIERYVSCPQRFFLESVLRLRPPEETSDELDERAGGGLAHLALERLFSAWREAGLLPLRGRAEEDGVGPGEDQLAGGEHLHGTNAPGPGRATRTRKTPGTAPSSCTSAADAQKLHTLSRDRAEVISLRLFGGLDIPEIARLMQKQEPAVRMLLHRGLQDLQTRLNPNQEATV